MRTVLCISALTVLSFVPVSAQQTAPPPTSTPLPATAPTTPPPTTARTPTAQPRTLPPTPSRPAPAVAAPAVNFAPQSGPTPAQGTPRPMVPGQNAPPAAAAPAQATSWQNVKLDIKISDSLNPGSPENVKTISMLILDGRSGQVRSTSDNGVINVDARPTVRPDGRIYLQLTMEYRPDLTPQQRQGNSQISMYNESLNLVVVDGKAIIASQSADPRSDRKVVVELTATVLK